MEKFCPDCQTTKDTSEFGVYKRPHRNHDTIHKVCKLCYNKRQVAYMDSEDKRQKRYHSQIKFKYGISGDEYDAMLEKQGGVCAICGNVNRSDAFHRRLAVDHDHDTGIIRGILCSHCNNALGMVDDNIETLHNMIKYLKGDNNANI